MTAAQSVGNGARLDGLATAAVGLSSASTAAVGLVQCKEPFMPSRHDPRGLLTSLSVANALRRLFVSATARKRFSASALLKMATSTASGSSPKNDAMAIEAVRRRRRPAEVHSATSRRHTGADMQHALTLLQLFPLTRAGCIGLHHVALISRLAWRSCMTCHTSSRASSRSSGGGGVASASSSMLHSGSRQAGRL